MIDAYSKADVDAVYIAVNEFKSAMAPHWFCERLLPVELPEGSERNRSIIFTSSLRANCSKRCYRAMSKWRFTGRCSSRFLLIMRRA